MKEKRDKKNDVLIGNWVNSYGSVLRVFDIVENTGFIIGEYTSTTGSSGTYPVFGYTEPKADGDLSNRAIAITIHWKSLDGGSEDPSWNWVSAMNGIFYSDDGQGTNPKIQLLHGMTANTTFAAVEVNEPGVYTESLVFTPYSDEIKNTTAIFKNIHKDIIPKIPGPKIEILPDFVNSDSESIFLSISNLQANGIDLTGSLNLNPEIATPVVAINGFITAYNAENSLRPITFCGKYRDLNLNQEVTVTFTGFMDTSLNSVGDLTLETFKSSSRTTANKYTAVTVEENKFMMQQFK